MLRPLLRTAVRSSAASFLARAQRAPLPLRPLPYSVFHPLSRRTYADEAVEDARGPPVVVDEMEEKRKAEEVAAAKAKADELKEDFGGDEEVEKVAPPLPPVEAQFFVSSIFPIRLGRLDPRPHLVAIIAKEALLNQFNDLCSSPTLTAVHSFKHIKTVKQAKDGGVFIRFTYVPLPESEGGKDKALEDIEKAFEDEATKAGGLKTWNWMGQGKVWRVLGRPWHEDLNSFPNAQLKVQFDGPDIHQETLYDLLRPYGHLSSITPPTPQPALTPRFALVAFTRLHSSTAAVSCLHGLSVPPIPPRVVTVKSDPSAPLAPPTPPPAANAAAAVLTRMSFSYQSPISKHMIRDWMSSHPKIALPLVVFLVGTLSYAFFDPIREFFVESKILGRFNIEGYTLTKYARSIGATILPSFFSPPPAPSTTDKRDEDPEAQTDAWRERNDAEKTAQGWLKEAPSGFIVLTGPHGSGKTALAEKVIKAENKKYIVIDCAVIAKAKTEAGMLSELANQTGYWPLFAGVSQFTALLDLAAVGLIGTKSGFATDWPTQLKQVLEVCTSALKHVSVHEIAGLQKTTLQSAGQVVQEAEKEAFKEKLVRIGHHDGRLDVVAGNGPISEVGYGEEPTTEKDVPNDGDAVFLSAGPPSATPEASTPETAFLDADRDAIAAMPVVVLKNFAVKGSKNEPLWSTIAEWAAGLVEGGVAQVVVVADNTSASKPLAKALPSKPLNAISLTDADHSTALSYVTSKLGPTAASITPEDKDLLRTLGGRMTDLDELLVKLRSGLTITDSVDDILTRTQIELRKSMYGDDASEAATLPWTRPQAWKIVSSLAAKGEVSYSSLLLAFPFKGHEDQLRSLEQAEFITITYLNGRPSLVKPGKPLFHAAFRKLVEDQVFAASQAMSFNLEVIASAEKEVQQCEEELLRLKEIGFETGKENKKWLGKERKGGVEARTEWVLEKMRVAVGKVEGLERENEEVKKVLSQHH